MRPKRSSVTRRANAPIYSLCEDSEVNECGAFKLLGCYWSTPASNIINSTATHLELKHLLRRMARCSSFCSDQAWPSVLVIILCFMTWSGHNQRQTDIS